MYDEINTPPPGEPVQAAGSSVPYGASAPSENVAGDASSRNAGSPPWNQVPVNGQGVGAPPPASLPSAEPPVPALAGLLGLIPGVGAMYNGQFAKGLAHLAIFAVLISLTDHVNGIFGLFVAGWVFYQAFEAYHTARARRDGLPLPNAFGLNDIGERLGFARNWPGASPGAGAGTGASWTGTGYAPPAGSPYTPPVAPGSYAQAGSAAGAQAGSAYGEQAGTAYGPPAASTAGPVMPVAPPPPGYSAAASMGPTVANWVGYIPPTAFAGAPPAGATNAFQAAPVTPVPPSGAAWNSVPYGSTDEGAAAMSASAPAASGRRFPIGALLLILLGGVFLLSNVAPAWRIGERWLLPVVLTATAIWIFVRRVRGSARDPLGRSRTLQRDQMICALRAPVLLLVLAVMFTLQTLGWLTIAQTWPLLLISLGGLLLLERTLGRMSQDDREGTAAPAPLGTPADPRGEAI